MPHNILGIYFIYFLAIHWVSNGGIPLCFEAIVWQSCSNWSYFFSRVNLICNSALLCSLFYTNFLALTMFSFSLQPEKVKFQLRLGQSKPIYNAFKAIQESPDWLSLSEARKRIVESKYLYLFIYISNKIGSCCSIFILV